MSQYGCRADIRVYVCGNAAAGERALLPLRRFEVTGEVVVERVPCSGRIDPRYVLKAFEAGTRAVCVIACARGDCQSIEGNLRLMRRTQAVRELLAEAGLDPDSLQVFIPHDSGERAAQAAIDSVARFINAALQPAYRMVA